MSFIVDETTIGLLCTSIAAAIALSYKNTPSDIPHSRLICQSYVAKNRNKAETAIYRSRAAMVNLRYVFFDGVKTPFQGFLRGKNGRESKTCLKWRTENGEIEELTYGKVSDRIQKFGSGLIKLGVKPLSMILISLPNCPEAIINELACGAYNYISVIVPESIGSDALERIINDNKIEVACVTLKTAQIISKFPSLKYVIIPSESAYTGILTQLEVENKASEITNPIQETSLDSPATVVFTPGTTGFSKGVTLSRKNQVAMSSSLISNWPANSLPSENDVLLSNLPHSLVTAKSSIFMILSVGGSIAFYNETDGKFFDYITTTKPTIIASSPKFWKNLDENLSKSIEKSGTLKKYLFNHASDVKRSSLKEGILQNSLWDSLIFKYVKELLGGRVKLMLTLCGPTDPHVSENLRFSFGCNLIEIYDTTETGPITMTIFGDYSTDHSGSPSSSNEVKLVDVVDLGMLATDQPNPRGEVCVRGHNVFLGYLKEGEIIKDGFDDEGFFHTGDIGEWTPSRTLKVVDRKKNFMKVKQGEWVALENLERVYSKSSFVSQILIYVNQEMELSCVIVPKAESIIMWAKEKQINGDIESLCKNQTVCDAVLASLNQIHSDHKLNPHEQIFEVLLDPISFESRGLESSNQRLKRHSVKSTLNIKTK